MCVHLVSSGPANQTDQTSSLSIYSVKKTSGNNELDYVKLNHIYSVLMPLGHLL